MRRMTATYEPEIIPLAEQSLSLSERLRGNVQRLRLEQNLSYEALAERLTDMGRPTNHKTLKSMLNNKTSDPAAIWIELFARALGCEEWELLENV